LLYTRVAVTRFTLQQFISGLAPSDEPGLSAHSAALLDTPSCLARESHSKMDQTWLFIDGALIPTISLIQWTEFLKRCADRMIIIYKQHLSVLKNPDFKFDDKMSVIITVAQDKVLWAGTFKEFKLARKQLIEPYLGAKQRETLDLDEDTEQVVLEV
jgi:hypothetical protein